MIETGPLCVVTFGRGPAWVVGRTTREQPCWDEHAAFVNGLAADERIVLAGPFADWTGALLIVRGEVAAVARELRTDPFVVNGVFTEPSVRPWLLWVDGRAPGPDQAGA